MMFVGGSCAVVRQIIDTIPTVGNLRGRSFSFPPEPLWVKLFNPPDQLRIQQERQETGTCRVSCEVK